MKNTILIVLFALVGLGLLLEAIVAESTAAFAALFFLAAMCGAAAYCRAHFTRWNKSAGPSDLGRVADGRWTNDR